MSMMMPGGEAPPGLPLPPGGGLPGPGGPPMGPMDSLNQGPIPAEGGLGGLLSALGGGGGEGPPALGDEGGSPVDDMDSVDIIKEAMKMLMVALAKEEDDQRGVGITKGMGALQGILGGEAKKNEQLASLGG